MKKLITIITIILGVTTFAYATAGIPVSVPTAPSSEYCWVSNSKGLPVATTSCGAKVVPLTNYSNAQNTSVPFNDDNTQLVSYSKLIQGTIYTNGYFYGTTVGASAQVTRFNPNDLSVQVTTAFGTETNAAEITFATTTKLLYAIMGNGSIYTVNPDSVAVSKVITNAWTDNLHSITNDGSYLYAISFTSPTVVYKYDISTYSLVASSTLTGLATGHNIKFDGTNLYATGSTTGAWVAKINPSTLAFTSASMFCSTATDDMALLGDYLYIGCEDQLYFEKITKSTLAHNEYYVNDYSYGMYFDGKYLYNMGRQNKEIYRIDPTTMIVDTITLPITTTQPNELVSDGQRLFFTTWNAISLPVQVGRITLPRSTVIRMPSSSSALYTLDLTTGAIAAGSFKKNSGTASQFLKADGTVDSSAYLTGVLVNAPLSGAGTAASRLSCTTCLRSTGATTTALAITGITDSLLATDSAGNVIATTSGSSSQWLDSGSDIYFDAGGVGIGTSTPLSLLTVSGAPTDYGQLAIDSTDSSTPVALSLSRGGVPSWGLVDLNDGVLRFLNSAISPMMSLTQTGELTVVDASTTNLTVGTDTYFSGLTGTTLAVDNNHKLIATTTPSNYWTLSGSNLYNNSGTNVGIGTTTPFTALTVSGNPYILGNPQIAGRLNLIDSSGATVIGSTTANARGQYSVDLQPYISSPSQVCATNYSTCIGTSIVMAGAGINNVAIGAGTSINTVTGGNVAIGLSPQANGIFGSTAIGNAVINNGQTSAVLGASYTSYIPNAVVSGISSIGQVVSSHLVTDYGDHIIANNASLGTEVVNNGSWTGTTSPWTMGAGYQYVSGSITKNVGSSSVGTPTETAANFATAMVAGNYYQFSLTISTTSPSATQYPTVTPTVAGVTLDPLYVKGTYIKIFKAVNNTSSLTLPLSGCGATNVNCGIGYTNVSIKPVLGGNLDVVGTTTLQAANGNYSGNIVCYLTNNALGHITIASLLLSGPCLPN